MYKGSWNSPGNGEVFLLKRVVRCIAENWRFEQKGFTICYCFENQFEGRLF